MKNTVAWLVKDKILLASLIGVLKTKDLPTLDEQMMTLFKSSPSSEIHVITDISMMTSMPGIFQMSKLNYIKDPQIGYFITQSQNPTQKFIGDMVGNLLKTKYKFVDTLDEAVDFLVELDATLPPAEELKNRVYKIRSEFIASAEGL